MTYEILRQPWLLKAWQNFFRKGNIDPGSVFPEPKMTSSGQGSNKDENKNTQRSANPGGGQYGDVKINS